jgi:DNA polymerase III subunit epsilon
MMYQLWWIDVETTGLDPRVDEIIEIALIKTTCNPLRRELSSILQRYTALREPSVPISLEASKVNGLTLNDLMGKHFDMELLQNIIAGADAFVAHNASFDRGFFEMLFPEVNRKKWFCSMKNIDWKGWGFPSCGLQSLLRHHHIFPERAHRAESDIVSLYRLLQEPNPLEKAYFWEMWDKTYQQYAAWKAT